MTLVPYSKIWCSLLVTNEGIIKKMTGNLEDEMWVGVGRVG